MALNYEFKLSYTIFQKRQVKTPDAHDSLE